MSEDDLGTTRRMFFPGQANRQAWTTDLPTSVHAHEDAIALPLTSRRRSPEIVGAVYDADRHLIADSQRAKTNRAWAGNPEHQPSRSDDVDRIPGHTYFGGHLRYSFGHVLLEVLPRFWPDPELRSADQVVFYATRVGEQARELPTYAADILRALDVAPERCVVIGDRALRFDRLTVASASFWLKRGFSRRLRWPFDRAGEALATAAPRRPTPVPRIYLSRSRLGSSPRRALNEVAIETIARSAGFVVVHPQELPVREQVHLVRQADVIAGCDGSALHLGAFARPGTKLVAFDSRVVPNQLMLNQVARLDALHALVIQGPLEGRTGDWTADLDRVRAALVAALD